MARMTAITTILFAGLFHAMTLLVGSFPASPQPDAGLTPDIVVTPTLRDIVVGKDEEIEKVNELGGHR